MHSMGSQRVGHEWLNWTDTQGSHIWGAELEGKNQNYKDHGTSVSGEGEK